jgi:tetraacyldisaccharide 4'-kinase
VSTPFHSFSIFFRTVVGWIADASGAGRSRIARSARGTFFRTLIIRVSPERHFIRRGNAGQIAVGYNPSTTKEDRLFKRATVQSMFEGTDPEGAARCALPFLSAASLGYGFAVRTRAAAYRAGLLRSVRLPAPVVSVGNLTVGGSGKTPLVIELARIFVDLGCRVGVLSRGYGGEEPEEPLVVSDGENTLCDDPARAGDEPVLIALRAPESAVVVCRSRVRGGRHAIDALGCDLLLLDDGFQHLALHRDLDIVVFRSENPFGNGRLLPRGPLREPFSALSRAHLFVEIAREPVRVPDKNDSSPPARETEDSGSAPPVSTGGRDGRAAPGSGDAGGDRLPPDIPRLRALIRTEGLRALWGPHEIPDPAGSRIYCFSGIGSPEGFERSAADLGGEVVGTTRFPDHEVYGPGEVETVRNRARDAGADLIVTTEKDGVKVRRVLDRKTEIPRPAIPAAELAISLDLPGVRFLDEVRTRLTLPARPGAG